MHVKNTFSIDKNTYTYNFWQLKKIDDINQYNIKKKNSMGGHDTLFKF